MTVKEALASEHADEWQAAIDEEVNNLILYNCFEVVPRSEAMQHGKLVKSKWVFKVKYDRDNNPYRFRARLVAKGFSQSSAHGDFDETYSPVMAYPSLRALLALAAANDYMITGFDVDHLYMESPDGVPKWKTTQEGRPAALHCLGSIDGLKQSSYLLHSRLSAFLQKHGYVPLVGDPCVYTRGPPGPQQELVACWFDGIVYLNHRVTTKPAAKPLTPS